MDNLGKPLRWKAATIEEITMLNDLQGNILKSHGRNHFLRSF